jgi:hypothetical protein
MLERSLSGFCHFLFNFPCSILSHGKRGTVFYSASLDWLTSSAPQGGMPENCRLPAEKSQLLYGSSVLALLLVSIIKASQKSPVS